jgi:uncharacterized membrane protein YfcA
MLYLVYLAYGLIGAVSGVMAGLLGIGGGLITVPCLFFLFSLLQFPQAYEMHFAIGTSLAAMMFNTFSSTRAHHARGAVMWPLFKRAVPGLIGGGALGGVVAAWMSSVVLEVLFGFFLCGVGLYFVGKIQPKHTEHAIPKNPVFSLIFTGIGALSVMLGLGGGLFSVPVLTAFRIPQKNAIGTSSVITFLMTVVGTVIFLILGIGTVGVPHSIGFIYLPAFFVIGIVSFFFAPMGARLAHRLPDRLLRKIFGAVLFLTGLTMLF